MDRWMDAGMDGWLDAGIDGFKRKSKSNHLFRATQWMTLRSSDAHAEDFSLFLYDR